MANRRIGLIGAGTMGAIHARVVATSSWATLEWIADPVRASAEPVADRWGATWLPEPDFGSVDAVVIAAPTQFHRDLGLEVLAAGLPVLIEKPVADNFDDVLELISRSSELGIPLMGGFLERFNPAVRTALEIAESPVHVSATRHSPYVERIRTGVASDLLIHDVDLVLRAIDADAVSVAATVGYVHPSSAAGSEDVAEASLRFSNGSVASVSASRISQRKVRSFSVFELDRLIEVDLLRQDITVYRNVETDPGGDDSRGFRQQAVIEIPVLRYRGEPLVLQWDAFGELLDGTVDVDAVRQSLVEPHRWTFAARDAGQQAG